MPYYVRDKDGSVVHWDFFGGNLQGVLRHLDDLAELGVNVLYFNPLFEAASNHKYDTGDYRRIDPMLSLIHISNSWLSWAISGVISEKLMLESFIFPPPSLCCISISIPYEYYFFITKSKKSLLFLVNGPLVG